jgi:hypothetical protein
MVANRAKSPLPLISLTPLGAVTAGPQSAAHKVGSINLGMAESSDTS